MPKKDTWPRRQQLLAVIRQQGYATNEDLARQFGVTVQTIRRDLNKLADAGRVARHHGGAAASSSIENIDYSERQVLNPAEKGLIAREAAAEIPNRSSLFINIGTTTEAFAHALVNHQDLRIITNNLNVAAILSKETDFRIIMVGGNLRNRDGGVVGQASCEMIERFRVDFGIIGISGIDEDGTLLDFDYDEVRAAQTILRNSRKTFLLADHSKFSRRPMVKMGSLKEIAALFTDRRPPKALGELLEQWGTRVHIAAP
ncbi:DeoR/GlpR family DNA-binding transcription regulator [Oceanibacterium hippocampi]|uniref:Glycerol-3-phosphate regulon repressor n=1 Tax=Oceanibacterium hippocampi TaxID=745714 RepID=A0A1Y5TFN2_9PROT|nr:DeoR family transcriptional regulator [Oceanibacterium hippocampi]SLN60780.1 Glycerol-3-phosphate regulon repressor [Oceanibacterium hippocampi]